MLRPMRRHPARSPAPASGDEQRDEGAVESADELSRRVVVQRLAFVGGGLVLLGACKEAPQAPPPPPPKQPLTSSHLTFTDDEFAVVTAAVDRVLPKDEDVGAVELGVPAYIDRALQAPQLAQMKQNFVPGVAALDRRCQRLFKVGFARATPAQQDEVLTVFKDSPEKSGEGRWYEMLIVLTLEGFLGDPSYGGNKDEQGWKLVGFKLVGKNQKGDPPKGWDGNQRLQELRCGGKKGC